LLANAAIFSKLIKEHQKKAGDNGIVVQELLQRYTIANVSNGLLRTDFQVSPHPVLLAYHIILTTPQTLTDAKAKLNMLQSEVKRKIFKPIFLNFPFFDREIIPSRKEARMAVARFSEELSSRLIASHTEKVSESKSESLGSRLLAAREDGRITERQFRDNLNVTFVAGQENPQLSLISTLYLLGKHPVPSPLPLAATTANMLRIFKHD